MAAMDFTDLAYDISYEAVGLAFDVVSVVSLDEETYGFWSLFLFFLIYPMVVAMLQSVCGCCAGDRFSLFLELLLGATKMYVYMLFSSWATVPVIMFVLLGVASATFSFLKYNKAKAAPDSDTGGDAGGAVAKGAEIMNATCGACCGNIMGVSQNVLLLIFTFFPETSPFTTDLFEIIGTIIMWSTGYTLAHFGDMMMLWGTTIAADLGGDTERSGAASFKLRIMQTIEYMGWIGVVYIAYLCVQYLFEGTQQPWESVWCVLYILLSIAAIFKFCTDGMLFCCGAAARCCCPREKKEDNEINAELAEAS